MDTTDLELEHHSVSALLLMSKPQLLPMQSWWYFMRKILSQGPNLIRFHPTIRTKKKKKETVVSKHINQSYINMHKERDRYSNTRQQQARGQTLQQHWSHRLLILISLTAVSSSDAELDSAILSSKIWESKRALNEPEFQWKTVSGTVPAIFLQNCDDDAASLFSGQQEFTVIHASWQCSRTVLFKAVGSDFKTCVDC